MGEQVLAFGFHESKGQFGPFCDENKDIEPFTLVSI